MVSPVAASRKSTRVSFMTALPHHKFTTIHSRVGCSRHVKGASLSSTKPRRGPSGAQSPSSRGLHMHHLPTVRPGASRPRKPDLGHGVGCRWSSPIVGDEAGRRAVNEGGKHQQRPGRILAAGTTFTRDNARNVCPLTSPPALTREEGTS